MRTVQERECHDHYSRSSPYLQQSPGRIVRDDIELEWTAEDIELQTLLFILETNSRNGHATAPKTLLRIMELCPSVFSDSDSMVLKRYLTAI